MKRNRLQIWHRCGTCGAIFPDLQELRSHLERHTGSKRRTARVDLQSQANPTDFPLRNRKANAVLRKSTGVDR